MARTLARYLVVSLVLVLLDACAHSWFEERPAWRHDAEVACLKSGAVRPGPGIAELRPIQGPGMCGADFPLRVTILGEGGPLGFADDPRPPGEIPQYSPAPPAAAPAYPPPNYGSPPYQPAGAQRAPLPITPEVDAPPADGPAPYPPQPAYGAPPATIPAQPSPAVDTVPLGPPREGGLGSPVAVAPAATLACPLVAALDNWMATGVQPAARRWFGQPVVEIKQISAYSCRSMNNQRGAPISEHSFGNALDVAAFTFADGRRVTVRDGWHGAPEERAFLHDVHASACRLFATVLAPGSNAFHYDHMHVDLRRHESGRSICEPTPIPGDLIARRGPFVTGSIAPRPVQPRTTRPIPTDDRFLPLAVPGED
ncbi:MAG TPA: extensin family protein [Xanthobacteraceae bacterium]|nr:extensin family protein [Xanthobacteraceae bacterium]